MNQANKFIVRDSELIAEGFELPVWLHEYLMKESKLTKYKGITSKPHKSIVNLRIYG